MARLCHPLYALLYIMRHAHMWKHIIIKARLCERVAADGDCAIITTL